MPNIGPPSYTELDGAHRRESGLCVRRRENEVRVGDVHRRVRPAPRSWRVTCKVDLTTSGIFCHKKGGLRGVGGGLGATSSPPFILENTSSNSVLGSGDRNRARTVLNHRPPNRDDEGEAGGAGGCQSIRGCGSPRDKRQSTAGVGKREGKSPPRRTSTTTWASSAQSKGS